MAVKSIPDGYHSVTPYLIADGAVAALEFYKSVFGATELMRMDGQDGKLAHAEFKVGDSPMMLSDEHPEMGFRGPKSFGGSPVGILLYFDDVDAVFAKAVAAGATVMKPLQNQFYGDRSGTVIDPWGHVWTVATHIEDVPPDEMARRAAEWHEKQAA